MSKIDEALVAADCLAIKHHKKIHWRGCRS